MWKRGRELGKTASGRTRGCVLAEEPQSWRSKAGVLSASSSLVTLTTYDVPADMVNLWYLKGDPSKKYSFKGRGIVFETELVSYKSIIIAPAALFKRSNDTPPHQVEFDVCSPDGMLLHHKGELVACDFHYNLAAISVLTNFPLQPATLAALTDVSSIDVADYDSHSTLGCPSDLFKLQPGTQVIALCSSFYRPFSVTPVCGVFRAYHILYHSCKELYWVSCPGIEEDYSGGALVNHSGQLLGILFHDSAFLPSNFVSRWWSHYKSTGKFCRPWIGVEVANLIETPLRFLEQFKNSFSDIGAGVIVTKVEKETPAYCSELRIKDVIIKCDGKWLQSKIEFFESMWENAGKSVELTVLRPSDGQRLDLSMSIGETTPTNFYSWGLPFVSEVSDASSDELSDASCGELSDASCGELSDANAEALSDDMFMETVYAQALS